MEIKKKELYLSPEVHIFEVKIEGFVCQSILDDNGGVMPGGEPAIPF